MSPQVGCPICAHGFDPTDQAACRSCPLGGGCPLVCCPECGHVTVDEKRSRLVRAVAPLLHRNGRKAEREGVVLADVPVGAVVEIAGFGAELSPARQEQLQAYGLAPGRPAVVVQQRPATVVCIDQTELALESAVAALVRVTPPV